MLIRMYPGPDVLQEVGRVTIAASRLDLALTELWWHLDPLNKTLEELRPKPAGKAREEVAKLVVRRLEGDLQRTVQDVLEAVEKTAVRRNDVVHRDWVLDSEETMRPVSDLDGLDLPADLPAYLDAWDRESKDSPNWREMPARSRTLRAARPMASVVEDLTSLERDLGRLTTVLQNLVFTVASAREVGRPTGWVGHPVHTNPRPAKGAQ